MRSGVWGAVLWMGLLAAAGVHAADDVAGAKDHPLLTRYPDSRITEYSSNYDLVEYKVAARGEDPTAEPVEGETTALRYFYNNADTQPSPLQLIRNYQNAVKASGGDVVYERLPADGDGGETTLKLSTDGNEQPGPGLVSCVNPSSGDAAGRRWVDSEVPCDLGEGVRTGAISLVDRLVTVRSPALDLLQTPGGSQFPGDLGADRHSIESVENGLYK